MPSTRPALKAYFQTGDKPTQSEFEDLIDSVPNLNEDGTPLTNATLPVASTSQNGIATQATNAEINTGTQNSKYVTPAGAKLAAEKHAPVLSVNGNTGIVQVGEDSGWKNAQLRTGFTVYGASWQVPRYRRMNDVIYLDGLVKHSLSAGLIFVLDPGFRPSRQILFSAISNNALARINIFPNGEVHGVNLNPTWVSLNGVVFALG